MIYRWEIDLFEMIRFLMLVIFSKSIKCVESVLDFVNFKNLSKICIFSKMGYDLRYKYNNFIFLIVVCYMGFFKVIVEFVNKGLDVNFMDKNGSILLVLVCWFVLFFDIMFLIDKGVKLCCIFGNGVLLFIVVVMGKNVELVVFFLKCIVDVN